MEGRAILSLSPVNILTIGLMAALFYLAAAGVAQLFTSQQASA
jgi:hypothetical protein